MATKNINTRIQNKHDTSTNWAKATNFVPLAGEIIVYDDLKKVKIGDGTTTVVNLQFANSAWKPVQEAKSDPSASGSSTTFIASISQDANGVITATKKNLDLSALSGAMIFKGTLGTGGTITVLPGADISNKGFTYKVITAGTYRSIVCKVGDVLVSNGTEWVLIPAGDVDTDTWRNIKVNDTQLLGNGISSGAVNFKSGSNITVSGSGNDITISGNYTIDSTPTSGSSNLVTSGGIKSALDLKISTTDKGAANGVATLGSDGKVPNSQLPSIGAEQLENITYANLVSKVNDSQLEAGKKYRITDYVTKVNGTYDLSDFGYSGYLHYAKSAEHPFDLVVTALDESTLDEHAIATHHSGDSYFSSSNLEAWDIKYDIRNDPTIYSWADSTNGKGVIFYMKDEQNNEAGYDFKNVLLLRYALGLANDSSVDNCGLLYNAETQPNRYASFYHVMQALLSYMSSGTYSNPFPNPNYDFYVKENILGTVSFPTVNDTYLSNFYADWYYTFDYYNDGTHYDYSLTSSNMFCVNNSIETCCDGLTAFLVMKAYIQYAIPYGINGTCFENLSIDWCHDNKIIGESWVNTFGNSCYGNVLADVCYSNTFGNYCSYNTFGNYCSYNTFGSDCSDNTFGNYCSYNTFGNHCYSSTFGSGCSDNTFGNYCSYNTFGSDCYYNYLLYNNTPYDSAQNNIFEKGVSYITLLPSTQTWIPLKNIHICLGVCGTSSSRKTITETRGLTHDVIYRASGYEDKII